MCFLDFNWLSLFKIKWKKKIIKAFQSIVPKSKREPLSLQTDKGSEFKNKLFRQYLKKNQIHFLLLKIQRLKQVSSKDFNVL